MSRRVTALCLLCQTSQQGDAVALLVARRAGQAGRDLATVGTYACGDLDCSAKVRVPVRRSPERPDPAAVAAARAAALGSRVDGFLDQVLRGS